VLYKSGKKDLEQLRYIQYAPFLEDRWPVCWEGWMSNPGSCDITDDEDGENKEGKACAAVTHPTVSLMMLLLIAGVARTRHRKRSY
jgi:hypothetical protein